MNLYIDTSHSLTVGLIDDNYTWLDFHESEELRSSGIIHFKIDEILKNNQKEISQINKIFIANGPGSYTGVRVGEGIGQIFQWQNVETYSFHHYQVPGFMGDSKGCFVCPAFKDEFFVYEWSNHDTAKYLYSADEFKKYLSNVQKCYSNQELQELDEAITQHSTRDIIRNTPGKVFVNVIDKKLRLEPFYFRELKDEFKKAKR